ncbi:FAD linked oxidase domain protein [Pseudogulbenkiania sp. NH8B]|uniref:FAD-binding and (Fe-S)-binding domain-containing protein n=1 Tax=Pseudogulbenkiania sp. (strain NH8B) TaxID=748280 RepID=UPI0002279803|nr:FAD-binding and (Fe-S)-binding domain-containing protein [Pseudogulbenkiania sp. NH8B]BAK75602.1 FAD linked oxidase domain protein [Pseudogulbenkiania sp. NH8B]
MLQGAYREFHHRLQEQIEPRRIYTDPLSTLAYGTDASCYRLTPKIVVKTQSEAEVQAILALAAEFVLPVTFRAAGTSLSGQAVSDSILVVASYGWKGLEVLENGAAIRLQPGVVGAAANAALAPFGRKIGPDPATINSAMIGGIVNNNSSGMCCGTAQNSYQTLRAIRVVLADGSVLDTADAASVAAFRASHAGLLGQLAALAARVRDDAELAARIRRKYKMKNTTGYSLNALVDFTDPLDILTRLIVGSEGTLAFVSEVTYHTVVEHPHKASALVFYPTIKAACDAVQVLAQHKDVVAAAELLDRASLRSVENKAGVPALIKTLSEDAAAILIETRAADPAALAANTAAIADFIGHIDTLTGVAFTDVVSEYTQLWNIRKGMFPSVGAMRAAETTVIIEDVAFPIEHLAEGTLALQALFKQFRYDEAIIFGHALEGNLHFVFTPNFSGAEEVARYEAFIEAVCRLVAVDYEGAVKAEHGTGRNMAPFVEMEWGPVAYRVMQEIKAIFDPQGILNPDVILTSDALLHVKDLKPIPAVDALVDKCIECGFCEVMCPSRAITLTPRQRIVANREMAALRSAGDAPDRLAELEALYQYAGDDTCTTCGLCETACPVGINTGKLTTQIRQGHQSDSGRAAANWLAGHYDSATRGARLGLTLLDATHAVAGDAATGAVMRGLRRVFGRRVPHWTPYFPRAAAKPRLGAGAAGSARKVVYLPSCLTRTFSPSTAMPDPRPLNEVVASVLGKAGYQLLYPAGLDNLCCGTPFKSKGALDAAAAKLAELKAALLAASDNGRWPVIVDNGVCTAAMLEGIQDARLRIVDVTTFIETEAAAHLHFTPLDEHVALHVVCSMKKLGQGATLNALARRCSSRVTEPAGITCCGFAGDKGFTYPELNASALTGLKEQVGGCCGGFSTSATCEIGLSEHAGIPYQHLMYLVDRATRRPG